MPDRLSHALSVRREREREAAASAVLAFVHPKTTVGFVLDDRFQSIRDPVSLGPISGGRS